MMPLWRFYGKTAVICLSLLTGCSDEPDSSGFAGLADDTGAEREGFRQPAPGDRVRLPADWGPHPEFRIEWWYLTANLETADGRPLGLQWTQFRQGLTPREPDSSPPDPDSWPLESAWMAHGAVSFDGQHRFSERFARGGIGQAGAQPEPLKVWLDHWQLEEKAPGEWKLQASAADWAYQLRLAPGNRIVRHGEQGFSAKSDSGQGSMYFSATDIGVEGTVTLDGETHRVQGTAWLDREWSSQFLRTDQRGWDWFALRLDSGARLMAFRVGDGENAFLSGTWIAPGGKATPLGPGELVITPLAHRETGNGRIPDRWRIEIPPYDTTLTVEAAEGAYWNDGVYPYWESPVKVTGDASGEGYMELTGYAKQ